MLRPDAAFSVVVRSRRLLAWFFMVIVPMSAVASGCKRKAEAAEAIAEPPVVKDATEGLQLTWIDEKGEFHIEQRVADVPVASRETVRVRVLEPEPVAPSGDRVFVADLRSPNADGIYPVRVVPRAEFEGVAVTRRSKSGTAVLAPKGASSGAAAVGPAASGQTTARDETTPAVIIYGASWCGPCHQAEAYMKKKGISYVKYDIEQDSSKGREMQTKLAKAGMHGGSIPVLDVRGRILVGFDPAAVEQALGAVR